MSFGDEYEGGGGRGRGGRGGAERTRTRFPGNEPADDFGDDFGGPARRPPRSSRSLVTVVGVVVLLIAAIAFANRSGGDGGKDTAKAPARAPRPHGGHRHETRHRQGRHHPGGLLPRRAGSPERRGELRGGARLHRDVPEGKPARRPSRGPRSGYCQPAPGGPGQGVLSRLPQERRAQRGRLHPAGPDVRLPHHAGRHAVDRDERRHGHRRRVVHRSGGHGR